MSIELVNACKKVREEFIKLNQKKVNLEGNDLTINIYWLDSKRLRIDLVDVK